MTERQAYTPPEKEYKNKSSMNEVRLRGHLGQDPEVKTTQDGRKFITLSLATPNGYKDKNGNYQEQTDWHQVTVFDSNAVDTAKDLSKGAKVYIEGQLQTQKYLSNEGETRYSTKVVLRPFKSKLEYIPKQKPQK